MRGRPYVTLLPPSVWTTLALTIHADGRHEEELVGASPFPRHWLYDNDGKLCRKVAVADFETWAATVFGDRTPWGGHELAASVIDVESALEHQLSVRVMDAQGAQRPSIRRLRAGDELVRQGEASKDVFLILNGLLTVEVDGETQMELGPGAIVGIRAALLGEGRRQATLRAVTPVTVAATSADLLAVEEMQQLVRQEDERTPRRDG